MSIRLHLTLAYCALVMVTFAALGWATYWLLREHLLDSLRRDLAYRCHALAEEVRERAEGPRFPEEHTAFESASSGYALGDAQGRPVEEHGIRLGDFGVRPGDTSEGVIGDTYWRSEPIVRSGRLVAMVLVTRRPVEEQQSLAQLRRTLLQMLPLLLLSAAGGGWFLAGRALQPVRELTRAVTAIDERDLHRRVPTSQDELGQLSQAFNALLARLQSAFARQQRFAADASHELRTPLSTVRALTSQKLQRERQPEEYREALQRIDAEAANMTSLLESLLFLARADAGQGLPETEKVALGELLAGVAESLAESYPQLELVVVGDAEVTGDVTLLTRLFSNLIENAVIHGQVARVEVELREEGQEVQVDLSDRGPGVEPQHLPYVRERFYQVDPARRKGGSGLGLAICDSIMELHGGQLRLLPSQTGFQVQLRFPGLGQGSHRA